MSSSGAYFMLGTLIVGVNSGLLFGLSGGCLAVGICFLIGSLSSSIKELESSFKKIANDETS